MSSAGAASRAAVPAPSAPTRAAPPKSHARAAASRKNGAKSCGPKTPEGRARSSQNALKHGLRAQKYVVLPEEDSVEFAELEAALVEELAPVGALQGVLARRVAVAAWRLARADRIEADLFAERSYGADVTPGLALIRDGNGTRSFETLLRYRGAAMAEFWRALRTLKALQAEQAAGAALAVEAPASRPAARVSHRPQPKEPERAAALRLDHVMPAPPVPAPALHEPAAPWTPNEPEAARRAHPNQWQVPAEPLPLDRPPRSIGEEHQMRPAPCQTNPSASAHPGASGGAPSSVPRSPRAPIQPLR